LQKNKMTSLKFQAIKGVKWTALSSVIIALLSVIKISILTRFIEKSDFGLFAIVSFIISFTGLFLDLGISSAIIHKQNITKKEYSSLFWLNIILSICIYILIFFITPLISSFYGLRELQSLIPIVTITLIISATSIQHRIVMQKKLEFNKIAIIDISSNILAFCVSIFLAYHNYGVYSLVYSAIATTIIASILFFFFQIKTNRLSFHFNIEETRPFLKIGIFQTGGQVINFFNRDIDLLIIGKFYSPEILGSYSLAKQFVFRPLQVFNPIINTVVSPLLAKIQEKPEQLKVTFIKILTLVSTTNFTAYLLVIIFAKYLVLVLYGPNYLNIVLLVQLLSVYLFIRSVGNPIGGLLIATGKTHLDFLWNSLVLILVPLCVYFGTLISINSVAISLIILSLILIIPAWYVLIKKMIDISLSEYLMAIVPKFKQSFLFIYKRK